MEKEDNVMFHLDPEVHPIKGQLQLANRCFMLVSKKKWLIMDNLEMLPQKVDGSLKSFRSQPLQKTLTPNTLILSPGNTGLPRIKKNKNKKLISSLCGLASSSMKWDGSICLPQFLLKIE